MVCGAYRSLCNNYLCSLISDAPLMMFTGNWSFSKLMMYEKCPMALKLKYVDRLPENPRDPVTDPLERGNRIHTAFEKYVKGESSRLVCEARATDKFLPLLDHARDLYSAGRATAEQDWLFNSEWEDTDRAGVWLWSKLDLNVTDEENGIVIPVDYKSGKSTYKAYDHMQQIMLYQSIAALKYPWADTLIAELWYVDEGGIRSLAVSREKALSYIGLFQERADKMYTDKWFRPRPSKMNCYWCPYGPKNGTGACPVGAK